MKIAVTVGLSVVAALIWVVLKNENESVSEDLSRASLVAGDKVAEQASEDRDATPANLSVEDLADRILNELELIRIARGEAEALAVIQRMHSQLIDSPEAVASSAIVAVLNSKKDAFAFGRFAPGADGMLTSYPTVRTALLDFLETIDPQAALEMGKEILDTSENVDEWALSLRALARHATTKEDRTIFSGKIRELLQRDEWLKDPTFSFLHAFDAAVSEGQAPTIGLLGELAINPPHRAVGHAATLSVDRFFQMHPEVGSAYIEANPEFLAAAPGFRATLMARVYSGNRTALESYLNDGSISPSEKATFFSTYPNFNSTFSHNLITGSLLLSRAEMRERSLDVLEQLKAWSENGRYAGYGDEINGAINRLAKTWKVEL